MEWFCNPIDLITKVVWGEAGRKIIQLYEHTNSFFLANVRIPKISSCDISLGQTFTLGQHPGGNWIIRP